MPGQDSPAHSAAPARPGATRWADLRLRVASALVLLPVGIGCLWLGGWAWAGLVVLAVLALGIEWAALCGATAAPLVALTLAATALAALGMAGSALILLAAGAVTLWWRAGAWPALGVPYVGLTAVALIWLRADGFAGRRDVLFLLLVVWATDIFAYVAGRLVGGPKLAPAISPGKTWSGAAGGLLGALLVGAVMAAGFAGLALAAVLSVVAQAAVLSVVAQAGDLLESALKRRFGVKDSGKLIPGHGGALDRLDGVLTAAPLAALLALAAGRGIGW